MQNRFNQIIIVGSSAVAFGCLKSLMALCKEKLSCVIETKENKVSALKMVCDTNNFCYQKKTKSLELNELLLSLVKKGSTLIVSADNELLIKNAVLEAPLVEAINFHYGLLPDYRGMNIPSWVIYNGEKETGFTWHYINAKVDDGEIIAQKSFLIDEKTTALDIVKKTMREGPVLFDTFIKDLLAHHINGKPNIKTPNCHEYKRKDLPNNGVLDLSLPKAEQDKIIRAYNYGRFSLMPKLIVAERE